MQFLTCVENGFSQVAVIVSGESGSGKTEAARHIVSYLTWRSARGQPQATLDVTASVSKKARATLVRPYLRSGAHTFVEVHDVPHDADYWKEGA